MFGKHHATGGQGGMVFTKDESLYWKVRQYADRGKPFGLADAPNGNVVPAINCNMDELHACIGRVQLKKLPEINRRRRELAEKIAAGCKANLKGVRLHQPPADCEGVYWFLFFNFDESCYNFDKKRFVECLAAEGVPASDTYAVVPMRMQWAVERYGQCDALPNLDTVDAKHFRCGFHEDWTIDDADKLVEALIKVETALIK
jgi:dTDP-4-amino-4,6-dideoxygalactose transaminase